MNIDPLDPKTWPEDQKLLRGLANPDLVLKQEPEMNIYLRNGTLDDFNAEVDMIHAWVKNRKTCE